MRIRFSKAIAVILLIMFAGCEKNSLFTENNDLLGVWINRQNGDGYITFERTNSLKANEYGLSFGQDGNFLERKIDGWCATPPVSYSNYEGTWSFADSTINISVAFWGGTMDYKWKLIKIDNEHLKISELSVNTHFKEK